MPSAKELEEFGLEVEQEHHSLIGPSNGGASASPAPSRRHSLSLSTPSKEQRSLLQSSNVRPSRLLRLGIFKWSILVLSLAIVVFVHLKQERDETDYVEAQLPEVEACEDDPEFSVMVKSEKNCATYVEHVERKDLLETRCNQPIGIPDENEFQKLLKHFCRKSCGLCGTEDAEEGVSDDVIDAKVDEIAEEIEVKEVEEQIEMEMKEVEEEADDLEKELAQKENDNSDNGRSVPSEDEKGSEDGEEEDSEDDNERQDDHSAEDTGIGSDSTSEGKEAKKDTSVDVEREADEANDSNSEDESNDEPKTKAKEGSANGDFGSFTLDRLQSTRKAAQDLVDMLEAYYYGKPQATRMMLDAWLSPWNFDNPDGTARERVDKIADAMARALVSDDQEEFIIGTIGSSVAAGHDNCHYDAYENQLERTFGHVWEAAGMKFVTQNAGQGGGCGDDYRNQAYCVKQNVSPEADVIHYTWTYFEEGDDVDKYKIRESLVRWTQMLPRRPPVHVLSVLWLPKGDHGEKERDLAEYYAKYGYNAFYMRSGHVLGGYDYETDKKNGIDVYAWGFMGDGYHNVTRYGANEPNQNRKDSLSVVMRNWHPGPLGFEFVSDTFAYLYSKAMLAALDLIEQHMNLGQDPRKVWSKMGIPSKELLPEPKHCDPTYCVVDAVPECLNLEKPTYGLQGARVVEGQNTRGGEIQNWKVWHEDNDRWHMVGKQDTAIFQKRDDKEMCLHLDYCGGVSATSSDDGTVVFRLPKMEVGLVAICGCCGKEVAKEMFLENEFLEISYGGAVLDRTEWDVFPNGKCVRLMEKFPTEGAGNPEHAFLSVKALEGLSEPVRISHVITL